MATHASRRTDLTGKAFENLCYDLLDSAGYNVEEQVNLGLRPTGGAHNVDLVVITDELFDERILVSLKYQDVAGTAEEKIPYEQMCLQHACETYDYARAIVVLAGPGWKHAGHYVVDGFSQWMNTPDVKVVTFDGFINEFSL